jgi:hypothetical protein
MPSSPSKKKVPSNAKKQMVTARHWHTYILIALVWVGGIYSVFFSPLFSTNFTRADQEASTTSIGGVTSTTTSGVNTTSPTVPTPVAFDTRVYDAKLIQNAHNASTTASTTIRKWPVKAPYPKAGALLPFHRIIAYYGNFYSTKMGVLGEYPEPIVLAKLRAEVSKWNAADPSTPVIPAIDYIAITAQGSPGSDGKYRFRMPASQIDQAVGLAKKVNGIVILDIQVGLSSLPIELPLLEPYLKLPEVHLAIDPEFAMHNGAKPGSVVGSFDAVDINYAATYLKKVVDENNLPPKILIVHRFTQPEVQIVMDMDGWGSPAKKLNTYQQFVATQPVQFSGFKLFYKNDLKPPSTRILTPAELLKLTPQPLFIQFQ